MRERRARMFQQNARVALVGNPAVACEVNRDGASKSEH